jgi:hypothetical protein
MAESTGALLTNLIELSRLDVLLTGIGAERKRLQTKLVESEASLKRSAVLAQTKHRALEERRGKYAAAEKNLKDERQKLVDRRKALTTLSNYKLQQAAEREIEHAEEVLSAQETVIIRMLEEIDAMSVDFAKVEGGFKSERAAFEALREETAATLKTLEERERDYLAERGKIAQGVDAASLTQYDRIKSKFPMGAVAKVEQSTCSGCFMQVGPQVTVLLSRGNALVRCPGCGRILFQDPPVAAAQS